MASVRDDVSKYIKKKYKAWIDEKKFKVGYEIPFTRYFYKYEEPRPSEEIMAEIMEL